MAKVDYRKKSIRSLRYKPQMTISPLSGTELKVLLPIQHAFSYLVYSKCSKSHHRNLKFGKAEHNSHTQHNANINYVTSGNEDQDECELRLM